MLRSKTLLGTVGDSNRLNVTVISDVVNVASLVGPGRFSLEKIGSTTVRGRVQPVDVWAARDFGGTTT